MDRSPPQSEPAATEVAWLVGVRHGNEPEWSARETLDELRELACTAGVRVAGESLVRLREPDAATWIGRGRAEAIGREAAAAGATLLIFDDDLAPAQARNLEDLTGLRALDRTQLILDIFAQRAHTSEGRLQIELAQLEYLRPRLRHSRGRLEQQRGGIGLRGPGETRLEMDRRRIDRRIARIRAELELVRERREELRRGRRRHGWALVCLVGYTNAGKSTLLNALCGAEVLADDRLFATLDPTTRRLELPNHQPALLTDTVGFIRKLPHRLIEAFQATLEEAARADLLVHVVDCAHAAADRHIEAVDAVLREIGAADRPRILALNKTDLPGAADRARRLAHGAGQCVLISAARGEGLDELRWAIAEALRERGLPFEIEVPATDGRTLALIREHAAIQSESMNGERIRLSGTIPARHRALIEPYRSAEPPP
ncbi:MAG: GTPase HflX [Kiritimatiellae bacterium]|nr:GTPase HflX [Kiritimatiellia bacterium]